MQPYGPLKQDDDDPLPEAGHSSFPSTSLAAADHPGRDSTEYSSEAHIKAAERRRYIYATIALIVSLIAFVVQTETAGYLANTLNFKKPIFMLYVTHSSWCLLWPAQIVFLRLRKWRVPWREFIRGHISNVLSAASMAVDPSTPLPRSRANLYSPHNREVVVKLIKRCLLLSVALNFAGSSWYIAVNLTSPADLTAIYNCSAFFAYAFSVPILRESFRWDKALSVAISIIGVVIVAYSGSGESNDSSSGGEEEDSRPYRAWGNLIIGLGAVLYGLYEVMYKRMACPPSSVSARRQAAFANVVGSTIASCTLLWLWPLLPLLHYLGIETFELPRGEVLGVFLLSVLGNVAFSGSFLILMSLTSPVLSSVASLLTTFLVAIVDHLLFGATISTGGIIGGLLIILAFVLLAHASWKELRGDDDDDDEDNSVL